MSSDSYETIENNSEQVYKDGVLVGSEADLKAIVESLIKTNFGENNLFGTLVMNPTSGNTVGMNTNSVDYLFKRDENGKNGVTPVANPLEGRTLDIDYRVGKKDPIYSNAYNITNLLSHEHKHNMDAGLMLKGQLVAPTSTYNGAKLFIEGRAVSHMKSRSSWSKTTPIYRKHFNTYLDQWK